MKLKGGEMLAQASVSDDSGEILAAKNGDRTFRDDIIVQMLGPKPLEAALPKELEYFDNKGVREKCNSSAAYAKIGKAPITVRSVDVSKGVDDDPNYSSRYVAREIRRKGGTPFFAPTPPLENLRFVLFLTATGTEGTITHDRRLENETRTQVSLIDIDRLYFCAKTDPDKQTFVDL